MDFREIWLGCYAVGDDFKFAFIFLFCASVMLSQLLNMHRTGGVRHTDMHEGEPFVPEPSAFEAKVDTGTLKNINRQALIRFQQNCFKQQGKHCVLRSITL